MEDFKKRIADMDDAEVEQEIDRLKKNEFVKLSKMEQQIRNRRRQYLYTLRWHEKNGRKLADLGWSPELEDEQDYAE
jgi:hypothetical protein